MGRVAEQLRATCPDLPALAAADGEALRAGPTAGVVRPRDRHRHRPVPDRGGGVLDRLPGAGRPAEPTGGGHAHAMTADLAAPHHRAAERGPAGRGGADGGLEGRRGGAGPSDSGMLWIEGVAVTVPTDTDFARLVALRAAPRGRGLRHLARRRPPGRGHRRRPSPLLRPVHRRRHPLLEDRPPPPRLAGQHRPPDVRLLGQRRPVRLLRDRAVADRRPHHRQEAARAAGRGGGGGQGARRGGRRHPDHGQHGGRRQGGAVRGRLRRRR